jgi:hypothetical protein
MVDEMQIAHSGEFNFKRFDFQEDQFDHEILETIEDQVDKKIFKYKYRIVNDSDATYFKWMDRVVSRFIERAKTRDARVEINIAEIYSKAGWELSIGNHILNMIEGKEVVESSKENTQQIREYMLKEAEMQYRDYYEDDAEEQQFFQYLDKMNYRDKIRFLEIFEDFSVNKTLVKW